jgi:hypothetical protein
MFFFKLPTFGPSIFTAHLIRNAGCDITLTSTLTFKWQCTFTNQFFWDMKQPHEVNGSRCLERSKFLILKSLEVILFGHCDYIVSVTDKWINMNNWSTRRKHLSLPVCPPQILHGMEWDWTRSSVGNAELKNVWSCTSCPPLFPHDVDRDIFILGNLVWF